MKMSEENQKLKNWCLKELEVCKRVCKSREEMKSHCTFCLGAVQYAQVAGLVTYEEVDAWWNEIREGFWHGEFGVDNQ
jgi:hypothetical protein